MSSPKYVLKTLFQNPYCHYTSSRLSSFLIWNIWIGFFLIKSILYSAAKMLGTSDQVSFMHHSSGPPTVNSSLIFWSTKSSAGKYTLFQPLFLTLSYHLTCITLDLTAYNSLYKQYTFMPLGLFSCCSLFLRCFFIHTFLPEKFLLTCQDSA